MDNNLLHSIDNRLSILEERSKAFSEIKDELRVLRQKIDGQATKQAATAATVAIVVSLLFSLLKVGTSVDITAGNHSKTAPVSQSLISEPRTNVEGRNH